MCVRENVCPLWFSVSFFERHRGWAFLRWHINTHKKNTERLLLSPNCIKFENHLDFFYIKHILWVRAIIKTAWSLHVHTHTCTQTFTHTAACSQQLCNTAVNVHLLLSATQSEGDTKKLIWTVKFDQFPCTNVKYLWWIYSFLFLCCNICPLH